jgi:hypothetical protein
MKLDQDQQKEFRSGVGMLLYLVKHSRPDISNAVRELSKVMDGATQDHMNTLRRVIKFVLSTKKRGVRMKPTPENGVVAYVDSDYAGDKGNRIRPHLFAGRNFIPGEYECIPCRQLFKNHIPG